MKHKMLMGVLLVVMTFTTGCTDKQVTACAKAAAGVSAGLKVVQQENEILYDSHKLTKDEATAIANAVNTGTVANDAFVQCVREVKGSGQQGQVVACFSALTNSLDSVKGSVLYVKNQDSQAALGLAWESVRTALVAVKSLMPQN